MMYHLKEIARILEFDRMINWRYSADETKGIILLIVALIAICAIGE